MFVLTSVLVELSLIVFSSSIQKSYRNNRMRIQFCLTVDSYTIEQSYVLHLQANCSFTARFDFGCIYCRLKLEVVLPNAREIGVGSNSNLTSCLFLHDPSVLQFASLFTSAVLKTNARSVPPLIPKK